MRNPVRSIRYACMAALLGIFLTLILAMASVGVSSLIFLYTQ